MIALCEAEVPFNQILAQQAFLYSSATYCAYATLDDWSCGPACTPSKSGINKVELIFDTLRHTFGYVTYNSRDDQIIVAFRGTNGFDW